jgi:hypothetical protein
MVVKFFDLRRGGSSVFGRNFFLSKNQLFILEMDSRAKTKYKKNKVKKNFKCENKKFCS